MATTIPTREGKPFKVLIVGGGIGGLSLAHGLKKAGIDFEVFERDPTIGYRPQGYRIKVHGDTVTNLRNLLDAELFQEFEETVGEIVLGESNMNPINNTVVAARKGRPGVGDGQVYNVDRAVLRGVVLKGLGDKLKFGKEFDRYEIQEDKSVIVYFKDGTSASGSLVVGADGLHSKVARQYLPNRVLVDTETCTVYGKTLYSPELFQRFPAKGLKWLTLIRDLPSLPSSLLIGDNMITLLVEKMKFQNREKHPDLPPDYVYWALIFKKSMFARTDEEIKAFLALPPRELCLSITSEWDPAIQSVMDLQDVSQTAALRIFSASPSMEAWEPSANVTLLGDAIHAMSPAGGVGAVTAIKDATVLLKSLTEKGLSAESIGAYEEMMRGYAKMGLMRCFGAGQKLFGLPGFEQCKPVDIYNA